jgi:hypothetical protein
MNLRSASSLLIMALAAAGVACGGSSATSSSSADSVSDDAGSDAGVQEGTPCTTNSDCASPLQGLTCVTDPDDGSQSCALCASSASAALAAVCGGDADGGDGGSFDPNAVQFSNDGTCGVDSCSGSDGGDDRANCRVFEVCPDGQHWDATQCGCVDGSQHTSHCDIFEECAAGKVWDDTLCKCAKAPTCAAAGGTCVALSPGSCSGSVIEGSCGSRLELGLECCSQ